MTSVGVMEKLNLKWLPCDRQDKDTQRCRMGAGLMASLNLRIGSPVLICTSGSACLCRAWPRSDLAEGYLQFDTKCSTQNFSSQTFKHVSFTPQHITPLKCPKLKILKVNVVVKSSVFKKRTAGPLICELVKEMLKHMYVYEKHVVNVSSLDTGIDFVLVENVNSGSTKAGLVTGKTTLDVGAVVTLKQHRSRVQESASTSLGGMEEVYASLKELLLLPLHYPSALKKLGITCPRGVLLIGPPGVGKTMLVRRVVKDIGATLITLNGPVVLGSRPGESEENLRKMFKEAQEASEEGPCVLLIDEIDSLCPKRAGSSSAPENRVVAQLLTLMDGIGTRGFFVTIGATNQPDTLDPAMRRPGRFDREVIIGVPTLTQRKSILTCLSEKMPLCKGLDLCALAEMTTGYVGADLSALCREAALQAIRNAPQSVEWPMKYPESFIRLGLSRPRGILLYGPPGCAKTTLVKAAATSSHCAFLSVSGADLFSPFVGDSEKALAQLFRQARACSPSIVFLDELDTILGSRGDRRAPHSVQSQLLSVLLNELDGVGLKTVERRGTGEKVCHTEGHIESQHDQKMQYQEVCNKDVMVVAASNRPDALDSALMRPGRLDIMIYVPPPDYESRLAVLQLCTENMPLHSDVCLKEIAIQTDRYSGADLENLCKEAALLTLQQESMEASVIHHKYFVQALQNMKPSLSAQQIDSYQNLFT
uniref:AAA+ ATPase domain-containing protein n=1 Tax=Denticeps clupeoides TaxID=299321 RepID=A0AAY4ELD6_9TELE